MRRSRVRSKPIAVRSNALTTLRVNSMKRRQRDLRALIAAADRSGDSDLLTKLTMEKVQIDRAMREL